MALSGESWDYFARHRLGYEWTASQNIAGNYSDVTVTVYLQSMDGYGGMNAPVTNSGTLTIDAKSYAFSATSSLFGNQKKPLASVTKRCNHNSDGSYAFGISVNYNVNVTFDGVTYGVRGASGDAVLNPIKRPYTFITNAEAQTFDSSTTVLVDNNGSGLKANLYLHFGNKKLLLRENVPLGSNFYVTVKGSDFADQIVNSKSGTGNFVLETLYGSTVVGSNRVKAAFTLPNNATYQPSITSKSVVEANASVKNVTGSDTVFVQSKSILRFKLAASGKYGATITNCQFKIGSVVRYSKSDTIDVPLDTYFVGTGALTATITVEDSRGYSSSTTLALTVQPYATPTITGFSTSRNKTTQTTIELKKTVSRSSIKNGTTEKNTYKVVTQYKLTSATTWTTGKTETNTSANFNLTGMATNKSYDILVTVTDAFGSQATAQTTVGTIVFPLNVHTDQGIGIGKMWESDKLDVGGVVRATGYKIGTQDLMTVLLNRFYPVGCIYESNNSANPSSFLGGPWEKFGNGKVLVGVNESDSSLSTANESGGSTNPLTEHAHNVTGKTYRLLAANGSGMSQTISRSTDIGDARSGIISDWQAEKAGNNASHANWQPYITVYRWRRTA